MYRPGLVLLLTLVVSLVNAAAPDPKSLDVAPADVACARELVRRLGSANYFERDQADRDLARMGRKAKLALAEAASSSLDPEVRDRCSRLLPRAAEDDRRARIAAFLADTAGRYDHDLPGWAPFKAATGATAAARTLFAEMLKEKANASLLAAMAGPPEELGKKFGERRQELWARLHNHGLKSAQPTLADLATLVLIEAETPARYLPRGVALNALLGNNGSYALQGTGSTDEVFKRVVARWVDTREDVASLYQALTLATHYKLETGPTCATRLLDSAEAQPIHRAYAALAIAKFGARDRLPAIEKHLHDEKMLLNIRRPGPVAGEPAVIQVRDTMLASALLVTGQKPEDYGFQTRYPTRTTHRFHYANFFLTNEARAPAFARWAAWRKDHPDDKK